MMVRGLDHIARFSPAPQNRAAIRIWTRDKFFEAAVEASSASSGMRRGMEYLCMRSLAALAICVAAQYRRICAFWRGTRALETRNGYITLPIL
jgi:hypothetical protein